MSNRLAASLAFCATCFWFATAQVIAQLPSSAQLELGRKLFTQPWESIETRNEFDADGLGPMFNAESCVACHNQGGIGGAGDNSTNVQVLSLLPRQKSNGAFRTDDQAIRAMFSNAVNLKFDFDKVNSTILHRSSTHKAAYASWQRELLELKSPKKANAKQVAEKLLAERTRLLHDQPIYRVKKADPRNRFTLQISRRNTPSLFGVSTIESILDDDIRAIALKQSKQDGPIKGIVPELPNGKVGKFGWRGEKSSVREFTAQACAIELGLSNSQHDQAVSPFELEVPVVATSGQVLDQMNAFQADKRLSPLISFLVDFVRSRSSSMPERSASPKPFATIEQIDETKLTETDKVKQHDMSDLQMDQLVRFVNSLSPLVPVPAQSNEAIESIASGRNHFNAIGCADCHVRNFDRATDVFSDFLLHDMGEELADAAGAIKLTDRRARGDVSNLTDLQVEIDNDRLWQTPPLWGAALSAPYLHDGRAKDFHAAITMHAGEAEDSANKYRDLSQDEKRLLLTFLKTLGDGASFTPFGGGRSGNGIAAGGWSSQRQPQGRLVNRRRRTNR